MKKIITLSIFFLFAFSSQSAFSQEKTNKNLWITLGKLSYKKQMDDLLGFKIDVPVFGSEIKKLEGEYIEIKGYIIPIDGYKSHKEFIFSAFPYSMCYFCGGAGPETVMEINASKPIKFTADQITLKGKFALNADDINRMMYILNDVELVE